MTGDTTPISDEAMMADIRLCLASYGFIAANQADWLLAEVERLTRERDHAIHERVTSNAAAVHVLRMVAERAADYTPEGMAMRLRAEADRLEARATDGVCWWCDPSAAPVGGQADEGPSISQRRDGAWRHDRCDGYVIFRAGGWECGECGVGGQAEPAKV